MAKNLFFLEAKCAKTGRLFYPRYDLAADDCWVLTYGQKDLPAGQSAETSGSSGIEIKAKRKGPQYKCPWCGNISYVRCGACHRLTCFVHGEKYSTCAYCGEVGEVGGYITDRETVDMAKSSGKGQ